jgi:hypothetical protein
VRSQKVLRTRLAPPRFLSACQLHCISYATCSWAAPIGSLPQDLSVFIGVNALFNSFSGTFRLAEFKGRFNLNQAKKQKRTPNLRETAFAGELLFLVVVKM